MALAKIVVDGVITKAPEKRFTQNNVPVTSFVMDINPTDETLIRVFVLGALAERVAENVGANDRVIVEGRPQIEAVKTSDGKEKRVVEINASVVEKISGNPQSATSAPVQNKNVVEFAQNDVVEDLINEDEIPF